MSSNTPTTITLPIKTRASHNFRTGRHVYDYRAVRALGWVAVWAEQDGPSPQWYVLADREGHTRSASRAEYESYLRRSGRSTEYPVLIGTPLPDATTFVPLDSLPDAAARLALILTGDYPPEDCHLRWLDTTTARPYVRLAPPKPPKPPIVETVAAAPEVLDDDTATPEGLGEFRPVENHSRAR